LNPYLVGIPHKGQTIYRIFEATGPGSFDIF
jgi:hypothetical protein